MCILALRLHNHCYILLRNHCYILVRYRQGMRGRMKAVILELLQEYYRVEEAFQGEYIDVIGASLSS